MSMLVREVTTVRSCPAATRGGGHFLDGRRHAVDIFQGIGKPRAFAVAQRRGQVAGDLAAERAQPRPVGRLALESVDVRTEQQRQRRDGAERLETFHHVAAGKLPHELREKPERELVGEQVGDEERAALRLGARRRSAWRGPPSRRVARSSADSSRQTEALPGLPARKSCPLRMPCARKFSFSREGELRRVLAFHEAREHFLHQRRRLARWAS